MSEKLTTAFVRKEYNRQLKEEYSSDYEFDRWFRERSEYEGYRMQYLAQRHHTRGIRFSHYLEIGPGPGTWTRMFIDNERSFTLLDISAEMLKQAKRQLGSRSNVHYLLKDVLQFNDHNTYDFVFSSRTIKYVPDRKKLFENIYRAMKKDGTCVIISQSGDTVMQRLRRLFKPKDLLHSKEVTQAELKEILHTIGFKDIKFYPVSILVGIPGVMFFYRISNWLWKRSYKNELNWFSSLLAGSWLVKMKK